MEDPDSTDGRTTTGITRKGRYRYVAALLFASIIFLGSVISPSSMMRDMDAVQAQIARNMPNSGDRVTTRLDCVAYLEKAPLVFWRMASSCMVFGVHDRAARTLALGHLQDLTLRSFAYLRTPLTLAAVAFLLGVALEKTTAEEQIVDDQYFALSAAFFIRTGVLCF